MNIHHRQPSTNHRQEVAQGQKKPVVPPPQQRSGVPAPPVGYGQRQQPPAAVNIISGANNNNSASLDHIFLRLMRNQTTQLTLGDKAATSINTPDARKIATLIERCRSLGALRLDFKHLAHWVVKLLLEAACRSSTITQLTISGGLNQLQARSIATTILTSGPPQLRTVHVCPNKVDSLAMHELVVVGLERSRFVTDFTVQLGETMGMASQRAISQMRPRIVKALEKIRAANATAFPSPLTPAAPQFISPSSETPPSPSPVAPQMPPPTANPIPSPRGVPAAPPLRSPSTKSYSPIRFCKKTPPGVKLMRQQLPQDTGTAVVHMLSPRVPNPPPSARAMPSASPDSPFVVRAAPFSPREPTPQKDSNTKKQPTPSAPSNRGVQAPFARPLPHVFGQAPRSTRGTPAAQQSAVQRAPTVNNPPARGGSQRPLLKPLPSSAITQQHQRPAAIPKLVSEHQRIVAETKFIPPAVASSNTKREQVDNPQTQRTKDIVADIDRVVNRYATESAANQVVSTSVPQVLPKQPTKQEMAKHGFHEDSDPTGGKTGRAAQFPSHQASASSGAGGGHHMNVVREVKKNTATVVPLADSPVNVQSPSAIKNEPKKIPTKTASHQQQERVVPSPSPPPPPHPSLLPAPLRQGVMAEKPVLPAAGHFVLQPAVKRTVCEKVRSTDTPYPTALLHRKEPPSASNKTSAEQKKSDKALLAEHKAVANVPPCLDHPEWHQLRDEVSKLSHDMAEMCNYLGNAHVALRHSFAQAVRCPRHCEHGCCCSTDDGHAKN